jgi:hypothetical protein
LIASLNKGDGCRRVLATGAGFRHWHLALALSTSSFGSGYSALAVGTGAIALALWRAIGIYHAAIQVQELGNDFLQKLAFSSALGVVLNPIVK